MTSYNSSMAYSSSSSIPINSKYQNPSQFVSNNNQEEENQDRDFFIKRSYKLPNQNNFSEKSEFTYQNQPSKPHTLDYNNRSQEKKILYSEIPSKPSNNYSLPPKPIKLPVNNANIPSQSNYKPKLIQKRDDLIAQTWSRLQSYTKNYSLNDKNLPRNQIIIANDKIKDYVYDIFGHQRYYSTTIVNIKIDVNILIQNMGIIQIPQFNGYHFEDIGNLIIKRLFQELLYLQQKQKTGILAKFQKLIITKNQFFQFFNLFLQFVKIQISEKLFHSLWKELIKNLSVDYIEFWRFYQFIIEIFCKNRPKPQPIPDPCDPKHLVQKNSKLRNIIWNPIKLTYQKFISKYSQITCLSYSIIKDLLIQLLGIRLVRQYQRYIPRLLTRKWNVGQLIQLAERYLQLIAQNNWNQWVFCQHSSNKVLTKENFAILFNLTYSHLYERKIKHQLLYLYFKKIDMNNNGYITEYEYMSWINQFISVYRYYGDIYWFKQDSQTNPFNPFYDDNNLKPVPNQNRYLLIPFKFTDFSLVQQVNQACKRLFPILDRQRYPNSTLIDIKKTLYAHFKSAKPPTILNTLIRFQDYSHFQNDFIGFSQHQQHQLARFTPAFYFAQIAFQILSKLNFYSYQKRHAQEFNNHCRHYPGTNENQKGKGQPKYYQHKDKFNNNNHDGTQQIHYHPYDNNNDKSYNKKQNFYYNNFTNYFENQPGNNQQLANDIADSLGFNIYGSKHYPHKCQIIKKQRVITYEEFSQTLIFAFSSLNILPSNQILRLLFMQINGQMTGLVDFKTYFMFIRYYFGIVINPKYPNQDQNNCKPIPIPDPPIPYPNDDQKQVTAINRFVRLILFQLKERCSKYDINHNSVYQENQVQRILIEVFNLSYSQTKVLLNLCFTKSSRRPTRILLFQQFISIVLDYYFTYIILSRKYGHYNSFYMISQQINEETFIQIMWSAVQIFEFKPSRKHLQELFDEVKNNKNQTFISVPEYINFIKIHFGQIYKPDPYIIQPFKNLPQEQQDYIINIHSLLQKQFKAYDTQSKGYLNQEQLRFYIHKELKNIVKSSEQQNQILVSLYRYRSCAENKFDFKQFASIILIKVAQIKLCRYNSKYPTSNSIKGENSLYNLLFDTYVFITVKPQLTIKVCQSLIRRKGQKNGEISYADYLNWIKYSLGKWNQ